MGYVSRVQVPVVVDHNGLLLGPPERNLFQSVAVEHLVVKVDLEIVVVTLNERKRSEEKQIFDA